ncbi:hypothetical protein ACFWJT_15580 [Streptomyces sp. NPDC127069]|uniref:hypothetical protein n=1 Tax=Streptomyces sp. NPDC127069 TaxID=3347128 RepID=UPI003666058D
MNTKAIGAAAAVICRAMGRPSAVPATIALALDANGMLASPHESTSVVMLRATIEELRVQLETAERQNRELDERLAERDEQIAGLLADEPTLDDDQPGVPA